jgi:hypothetical protein
MINEDSVQEIYKEIENIGKNKVNRAIVDAGPDAGSDARTSIRPDAESDMNDSTDAEVLIELCAKLSRLCRDKFNMSHVIILLQISFLLGIVLVFFGFFAYAIALAYRDVWRMSKALAIGIPVTIVITVSFAIIAFGIITHIRDEKKARDNTIAISRLQIIINKLVSDKAKCQCERLEKARREEINEIP